MERVSDPVFFDFHTHRPGPAALVSAAEPPAGSPFWSLQYHPWDLPENFSSPDAGFLDKLAAASALGEIGLDRLKGPDLSCQRIWLANLLAAAEKLKKPVVIHCVRCDAELDAALSRFSGRVLIHGFRGSEKRLLHHLERGRFVSFAPGAWRDHAALLRQRGLEGIGLETDDKEMYISEVYRQAEEETGIAGWGECCRRSFIRFIG